MSRSRTVAAWIIAGFLAFALVAAGSNKFTMSAGWVARFADWGYAGWFVAVVGGLEMAGGVLVLVPRLAVYGAGLIAAVMLGATYTHLSSGIGSPVVPVILTALCGTLVWLRHPRSGRGSVADS